MESSKKILFILLLFICVLTQPTYLGLTSYHTKGEPREAIVAVSMLQTDNWILPVNNGGDLAYKPPFFHWCIALCSLPIGHVNEFTSRLPSAIALIVMTMATFLFFAKRTRKDLAFLASLLLFSCIEIHRAGANCRVDMVMTCFIVLALFQMFRWCENGLKGIPVWGILFMSAATLTKGPVGIVLPCAVAAIYMWIRKAPFFKTAFKFAGIALLSCILPFCWYYAAYLQGGQEFLDLVIEENFARFVGKMSYASHEEPAIYYVYTTILGWMPWAVLVLISLFMLKYRIPCRSVKEGWTKFKNYIGNMNDTRLFSLLAIVIILGFYCIPKSKRTVYVMPIYPFMAYFLAEYMVYLLKAKPKAWRIFGITLSILAGILLSALIALKCGWINSFFPEGSSNRLYVDALSAHWDAAGIVFGIFTLIMLYRMYKSRHTLAANNRYLYNTVTLFFCIQLLLDFSILPTVLNTKSIKPFAEEICEMVPEGKIYSHVTEDRMLRFYVINFYADNRVVSFVDENPQDGYLLVNNAGFRYIHEHYGERYDFEKVLQSDRSGNDVKGTNYLYRFGPKEAKTDDKQ